MFRIFWFRNFWGDITGGRKRRCVVKSETRHRGDDGRLKSVYEVVWGPRPRGPTQSLTLEIFFLTFRSLMPFPFLLLIFLSGFSPNSTQSSSNRIYSSFPQFICHHSFPFHQVTNQMGKHKTQYKATVDVPFCFLFKHPFSPISNSSSPLFLSVSPSHVSFSNQQAAQHPSTLPPLFSLFLLLYYPSLLPSGSLFLSFFLFFIWIEAGTLRWNLLPLIE